MKALFFGKSAISIQEVPVSYRVNGVRESSMILFFRKIAHRHQLTLYLNALTGKGRPLQGVYIRKISLRNLTFFHTYIYIDLLLLLQIYVYMSLLMDGLSLNIFDDIGVLHDDIIWCGSF